MVACSFDVSSDFAALTWHLGAGDSCWDGHPLRLGVRANHQWGKPSLRQGVLCRRRILSERLVHRRGWR